MFFIDNWSKIRLLLKHNFIDQIGQNVQIMKRTYKSNHLYEVYSTLTCYKLKDNPTGSSNWLVSGKSHFQIKWQSWKTHDSWVMKISFSEVQRGNKRESDKCPSRNFRCARSSEKIYSRAPPCVRIDDSMQSKYQITCWRQGCFLLCNHHLSERRMAERISTTF